ncbi:hypothetical protein CLOSYM_03670 [[Clostridium] symbiosum ATCC 14940]|uniref:Uncharacterized protein n=1 Tax=[Clostridium] symbiosum ATCC 14940 TaxID=411472 RepID=A0ABC9TU80_CLOSY|nr:hypothetical protein CLOSYM_03670 [[Clostridium] symbiosum ATCC 14940]
MTGVWHVASDCFIIFAYLRSFYSYISIFKYLYAETAAVNSL